MIRVTALYPNRINGRFDHTYYAEKHMPMVARLCESFGYVRGEADKGLSGAGGSPAPFVAAGHLYFNSVEDFEKAFGKNGEQIMADVSNYTDIEPQFQISEITT